MNAAELIQSIKLNGSVAENQVQYSDEAILRLASEEQRERLIPFVMSMTEGYLEYTILQDIDVNKSKYRISPRAVLGAVTDVSILSGVNISHLNLVSRSSVLTNEAGATDSFYYEGSSIVLYRKPSQTGVLLTTVNLRPSEITKLSNHSQAIAFDSVLQTVQVSSLPSGFQVGALIDFQERTSGFELIGIDNQILSINTNTNEITFKSPLPDTMSLGVWLCPAATTPIPQVPEDLHSTLALMTASRILLVGSYLEQRAVMEQRIKDNLGMFSPLMYPRNSGMNQHISSPLL